MIKVKIKYVLLFLQMFLFVSITVSQSLASKEFKKIQSKPQDYGVNALRYLKSHKGELAPGLADKIVREAIKLESKEHHEICYQLGAYYYERQKMQKAYQYLYTALKNKSNSTSESKKYAGDFHKYMGFVFAYFERKEEAIHHLKNSLTYKNLRVVERIKVYNNLGLIYFKMDALAKAENQYWKGYNLAKKTNHIEWTGIIAGNIGSIAFKKGQFELAKKLVEQDYQLSKENGESDSQIHALLLLAEIEMLLHGTATLQPKIQELDSLIEKSAIMGTRKAYYRFLKFYNEEVGDFKNALLNQKKFQLISDSIVKNKDLHSISKFEFQMEFEQKQSELKILNERRKQDQFILISVIIILTLSIVAVLIIVRLQVKRRQQERKLLMLQKSRIRDELNNSEKELQLMLSELTNKSDLVDTLKEKIDLINSDNDSIKIIDSLQSFTLLTEDDWSNFKKLFSKLNPGFFTFLNKSYPEITSSETRFITLIRLNLSNSEMANALGISPDSVRKTSLRLRKKLTIETHEELVKFILEIGDFNQ